MLYHAYELSKMIGRPINLWAQNTQALLSHSSNAFAAHPMVQRMAACSELVYRLTHEYDKPAFNIHQTIDNRGNAVEVTQETALSLPFCDLIHLKKNSKQAGPRVLIVAPLSGHYATLLRNTIEQFLPDHDVYITDWVNSKDVPNDLGPWHLFDYVQYLMSFFDRLETANLHVVAVCQPTVPVLIASSLLASRDQPTPASLTLIGGPIDTSKAPTSVNVFAKSQPLSWFTQKVICRVPIQHPGFLRRVYPGFLQHSGFVYMNLNRHLDAHWKFFSHLVEGDGESAQVHRNFYNEYNSVMDIPAEFYLDTIEQVFQEHRLPKGTMAFGDERVSPEAIKNSALLAIEGELDDISGLGQTKAALDLCSGIPSHKKSYEKIAQVGHYGLFSGRRFRQNIYPKIKAFIAQNDPSA